IFERVLDEGAATIATDVARELGLRAARIWDTLGASDPDALNRAERRFRIVLDLGANLEALEALERIYRARGDAALLAVVLEPRAEEELDLANKKTLLAEAARIQEGPLASSSGAIATWRKLLDVDDSDIEAMDALARLYEAGASYADLVALLVE